MKIISKIINKVFSFKSIVLKGLSKPLHKIGSKSKDVSSSSVTIIVPEINFDVLNINASNLSKDITNSHVRYTAPIIVDNVGPINAPIFVSDETFVRKFEVNKPQWFFFGVPLNTQKLRLNVGENKGQYLDFSVSLSNLRLIDIAGLPPYYKTSDAGSDYIKIFFDNYLYANLEDDAPIPRSELKEYVQLVKSSSGEAYLPEWGYNSIPGLNNAEALQIRLLKSCCLKVTGEPNKVVSHINDFPWAVPINPLSVDFTSDNNIWLYFSNPFLIDIDIKEFFGTYITDLKHSVTHSNGVQVNESDISIIKDDDGFAIVPTWDFYYFRKMEPGDGYQIKLRLNSFTNIGDSTYKG